MPEIPAEVAGGYFALLITSLSGIALEWLRRRGDLGKSERKALKERVVELEKERDEWRERFYDYREEHIQSHEEDDHHADE